MSRSLTFRLETKMPWHQTPSLKNTLSVHTLIDFIGLISTNKLVCGGRSGAQWLPSHHPSGCCTLVVDEEIPPFYVKCFEYPEKRYINVRNYYYY